MQQQNRPHAFGASWRSTAWAVTSAVAMIASGCGDSGPLAPVPSSLIEANIDTLATQVGGGTQAVELYTDTAGSNWTLYTMANRFAVTPVGTTQPAPGSVPEITVPGYIQNITVVKGYGDKNYALLSMGGQGIGVVDITNPAAPALVRTMTVSYDTPAYTYSDGGGTIFTEEAATGKTGGTVNDVLVDDRGTPETTDDELFIANTSFGIQKTKLANLMGAAANGVLPIESGVWTLKYAGENPWGGPLSLKLHGTGSNARLYAALGFLGIGVYNPTDLAAPRIGAYNLYADCTYRGGGNKQEDWFGYPERKIACPGSSLDTATNIAPAHTDGTLAYEDGMPTFVQAAFELKAKNDHTWYPWAEFDRYGKYYYNARTMDLVDLPAAGGQPARTVAYIAYSLGGLVAVDLTNPAAPVYEGYVPAAPAHGPDEPPINVEKKGILSHFGSGMLKEAGVMDVRVSPDTTGGGYKAYYTDHFAGLVVVGGAQDPRTQWKNAGCGSAGCDNNRINGVTEPRVYWPDYEFVTSYDMHPVVVGDESLPAFLVPGETSNQYAAPMLLSTGEINGHGGSLFLMPTMDTAAAGAVDAVQSSGAGGVSFVDFNVLEQASTTAVANRFGVPVNLVSTREVGAAEDGSATQPIAIGHGEGVTVSGNHLYFADGPHGMSVWRIADGLTPIDDLHLVANTLQSEYPTPGSNVLPTPHAFKVGFGSDPSQAHVMSQSLGMRRVDLSKVLDGSAAVGAPVLLNAFGGIYEHGTDAGKTGPVEVTGQDHAYGVAFHGKYAIVADGDNGLTVYDTTANPATLVNHVVGNIGDSDNAGSKGKPPLGRAASVKLWTNAATGRIYAVVAAGAYGVSVVDMTAFLVDGLPFNLDRDLLKTFEPVKSDADNAFGSADGKSVDVHVLGDMAYFSYDSFGLVAYRMADLIRPAREERPAINPTPAVCATIDDVTKLSAKQGGVGECRPTAAGYLKLQKYVDATGLVPYAEEGGGALYMTPQFFPANTPYINAAGQRTISATPRLLFYVAYGESGVVKLDWSDVAKPSIIAIKGVIGGAAATAIHNGRVYVAAGSGGLSVLK
jgi:hypothetical protein